ncbi:MAG: phosphomannomutase/phosphoglucomutase [Gemmatimonadales bacterium]|nr:MAG: phosphomannomutase/phosphoglucomutase [Gemmatimonadales bacterium]
MNVSRTIFREYDIRGVVGDDLTDDVAFGVGRAYATRWRQETGRSSGRIAVGHDNRPSSPALAKAMCDGLNASGLDVVLLDTVPTPTLYYATVVLETDGGIQITGSHNPPEYNGIKMVVSGGSVYGDAIQDLRKLLESESYFDGQGSTTRAEILDRYAREIGERARVDGPVRVVLDCGNGTGSVIAPEALRAAGIEVLCLYCESDGSFPNHHPDPTVDKNLVDLIAMVRESGADLGIGLDGDADRIGAVDGNGRIVRGDHLLLLFALDVLPDLPGSEIVFDVKCSQALPEMIEAAGGVPIMWKTGHSLIKERMKQGGSPVAGEMSGHICFADRFYGFDDAIYAAARLAQMVQHRGRSLAEMADDIPAYPSTPELRVDCTEDTKFEVVEKIARLYKQSHDVVDIDGVRILFEDGWALVRASNTQPVIVVRFESRTQEGLSRIRDEIAAVLASEGVSVPELTDQA